MSSSKNFFGNQKLITRNNERKKYFVKQVESLKKGVLGSEFLLSTFELLPTAHECDATAA